MMTDDEIAAIRARAEEATPGPWKAVPFDYITAPAVGRYVVKGNGSGVVSDDDALFIAAAREAIPALLAEVERWRTVGRNVSTMCHWTRCVTDARAKGGSSLR